MTIIDRTITAKKCGWKEQPFGVDLDGCHFINFPLCSFNKHFPYREFFVFDLIEVYLAAESPYKPAASQEQSCEAFLLSGLFRTVVSKVYQCHSLDFFLWFFLCNFPLRELLVKDLDTPCRCCAADGIASADCRGLTFFLVSTGTIDPQGIRCRSMQVLSKNPL